MKIEGPEFVPQRLAIAKKSLALVRRIPIGKPSLLRNRNYARMIRRPKAPTTAPATPRLAKRSQILAVVRDEDSIQPGRHEPLLGVACAKQAVLAGSENIVPLKAQRPPEVGHDIGVKRDGRHTGQAKAPKSAAFALMRASMAAWCRR